MREDQGHREATVVTDAQTLELFRIADAVQSVTVEVRCDAPCTDGEERYYPAEIVLRRESGRVGALPRCLGG
jgi:hypothetical protein